MKLKLSLFLILHLLTTHVSTQNQDPNYYSDPFAPRPHHDQQKRSISETILLLVGGDHPTVPHSNRRNSLHMPENDLQNLLLSASFVDNLVAASGIASSSSSNTVQKLQDILATKAKLIPHAGQMFNALYGAAQVKGEVLRQVGSLGAQLVARGVVSAAARAVSSAAAAQTVAGQLGAISAGVNAATNTNKGRQNLHGSQGGQVGWGSTLHNTYLQAPVMEDSRPPYAASIQHPTHLQVPQHELYNFQSPAVLAPGLHEHSNLASGKARPEVHRPRRHRRPLNRMRNRHRPQFRRSRPTNPAPTIPSLDWAQDTQALKDLFH